MKNAVVIVEDDDAAYGLIQDYIQRFSSEADLEVSLVRFGDGLSFLSTNLDAYEVVLLDIELPDMDGLTIAKRVREKNKACSIVFITNLAKYAQYGYEVNAVSYLIKPVKYDAFALTFRKAINAYAANEECDFIIKIPGGMEKISVNQLMYVEILSHIVIYHLVNGTIQKTGTISKAEKELSAYGFLRCHNAYLINPAFVRGIKENNVIVGSEAIPLSRGKKQAFLSELSSYFLKKAEMQ